MRKVAETRPQSGEKRERSVGASGRTILKAILAGEEDAERLAEMSKGLLRNKVPELRQALEGRVTEHHRFLLKELRDHQEFIEGKVAEVEAEIESRMRHFEAEVERLDTIPGVDRVTAWSLIAAVGVKMEQFLPRGTWPRATTPTGVRPF